MPPRVPILCPALKPTQISRHSQMHIIRWSIPWLLLIFMAWLVAETWPGVFLQWFAGSRLTGNTLKAILGNGQQLRNAGQGLAKTSSDAQSISIPICLAPHPERMPCAARLTEHRAGRDGLPVEPEGHLGQDDGHDAGQVGLDHKVPDLPLEVEVSGHDDVFPCRDSQVGAEPQFASRGQLSTPEIALNTLPGFSVGFWWDVLGKEGCRHSQLLCHVRCVPQHSPFHITSVLSKHFSESS